MANFGNYETVEQIASSGPFTLYKARGGAAGDVAVKVYESQAAFIGELWDRKAENFVQSALLVKTLTERGAKRWNPVFDAAKTEDYAFYAAALKPLSLPRFLSGVRKSSARELGSIIAGIAEGLIELRDAVGSRGHGRLNSGAVLLGGDAEGGAGEVFLCDAAAPAEVGPQSASDDKIALGKLIFEMVMRREAPISRGFAMTSEWSSLGAGGKLLFELSDALYAGAQCTLTLEQIRDRALSIPASSTGAKGLIFGGIAAALVLGAGGAFVLLREKEPDPIPVPPIVEKTGACITLASGATEWTCDVITKAACDEKQGRYLGDDKPAVRFLVDPRETVGWEPALTEDERAKWEELEDSAELVAQTKLKYEEVYLQPLRELNARLKRVGDDPKWVPRPDEPAYADPTLTIEQQQRTINEFNDIRAQFASFRIDGERMVGLVAEIDRISSGNMSEFVNTCLKILSDAEAKLNALRVDFDENMMQEAGYDPKEFDFDSARINVQALLSADGAAGPADSRKRDDARRAAQKLSGRVTGIDSRLGTLVKDKIIEASKALSDDLPSSLRDAFTAQIEKLANSSLGASNKYARAQAAQYWAQEITRGFAIEGLASLDGVFDAATFDRIKGEKASRAVNEFAGVVAALEVFPARDDKQFADTLARASGELAAWREKARNLGVGAEKIKARLRAAYAPDEQVDGESIDAILQSMRASAEWTELQEAFKPLADLEASLNSIARDDLSPERLVAVITDPSINSAIAASGKRIAWKRLSTRGDWPTDIDSLRRMPALAADLKSALERAGVAPSRIQSIADSEIKSSLATRWVTFVNERLSNDGALIESLYAPETRKTFFVSGETPAGLNEKAKFNFDLMRARAEAAGLSDAEIPAFISRWESALASDERLARAFLMWKAGKFATDWKQVGPGLAGWKVENEESEDHVVYTKQSKGATYTLRFNKVGESSMVCTTEFTVGLLSMMLSESGADATAYLAKQFSGLGFGVSPWYFENVTNRFVIRRPSTNPEIPNLGWLIEKENFAVDGVLFEGRQLFVENFDPPGPDTPLNFVSASGALALSHALGCRLPSVAEWSGAKASGDSTPNLRDAAFSRQFQHAAALPIEDVLHLPSAGRFPVEDPTRTVDPRTDGSSGVGDDGIVFFRPAPGGSSTFLDLEGNVAEWILESGEKSLEVTMAQPLTTDQRSKFSKQLGERIGVVGASALSPAGLDPSVFVRAAQIPRFRALNTAFSYSDVGFRLAFTAEGGGGGSGQPSETVRRRLLGASYR